MVDYAPLMAIGGAKILDGLAFYFKKMMWQIVVRCEAITSVGSTFPGLVHVPTHPIRMSFTVIVR